MGGSFKQVYVGGVHSLQPICASFFPSSTGSSEQQTPRKIMANHGDICSYPKNICMFLWNFSDTNLFSPKFWRVGGYVKRIVKTWDVAPAMARVYSTYGICLLPDNYYLKKDKTSI